MATRNATKFSAAALVIVAALMWTTAHAADRFWVATESGSWSDPVNWDGGTSIPSASDAAHFNATGAGDCAIDASISITSINIADYPGTITQGANSITLSADLVQAGGSFQGGTASISVSGSVAISGGSFCSTSGSLTVREDCIIADTATFDANGGTVRFVAFINGTQDIDAGTAILNDVVLKSYQASYHNIAGILTVNNLRFENSVYSGGRFNGIIDVNQDVVMGSSDIGGLGTLLIRFVGTGNQTLNAEQSGLFHNIEVNKPSGMLQLAGTPQITGSWTWTNGLLDATAGELIFRTHHNATQSITPGSVAYPSVHLKGRGTSVQTINGSWEILGDLKLGMIAYSGHRINGGPINLHGDAIITNSNIGKNTSGLGSVVLRFVGSTDQALDGSAGGRFGHVEVDKPSGDLVLFGTTCVYGNWTWTQGSLNANGATLVLGARYNSTQSITPGSVSYGNVTLKGWGQHSIQNIAGVMIIAGNLELGMTAYSGHKISGQIDLHGDVAITSSGIGTASGGLGSLLLRFVGDQDQTMTGHSSGRYGHIEVIKPSGVLQLDGSVVNVYGNWTWSSGDLNPGTSKLALGVRYNSLQTIDPGPVQYGDVELRGWAETSVQDVLTSMDIGGNLTLSVTAHSGNKLNGGPLNVEGDVTMASSGFGTGSSGPGNAIIQLIGDGAQTLAGNTTGRIPAIVVAKAEGSTLTVTGTPYVSGNWTWTSGSLSAAGSTMVFAVPYQKTQTITAGDGVYGNVTIKGRGANSAHVIDGTLNVGGNLCLGMTEFNGNEVNGGVIAVQGDAIMDSASFADGASPGTATIQISGTGAQSIIANAAGHFPSIEINKPSGTLTLQGNIEAARDWNQVAGTVDAGDSTVTFVSRTDAVINGSAVFNDVVVAKDIYGGSVTVAGSAQASGDFSVTQAELYLAEDGEVSVGGDVTLASTAVVGAQENSLLKLDGTEAQSVEMGGHAVKGLEVSNAAGIVRFLSDVQATSTKVAEGASIVFAEACTFSLGELDINGSDTSPVTLASSVAGSPWNLVVAPFQFVRNVQVQDSDASGGPYVTALDSQDLGNNVNWIFQGPGVLQITSPAESRTNPAWVEGTSGPDAVSVQIALDGEAPFDAYRMNPTKWYADNAGSPLGLNVSPDQAVSVEVTVVDVLGETTTANQTLTWVSTDLNGMQASSDEIRIRKGDSLLLTASGTGTLLEIDADGDGTFESSGAPGDVFPSIYSTAGSYTAEAKVDDISVGTVTVTVVGVDLKSPVAAMLGTARPLEVYVEPAAQNVNAAFVAFDPNQNDISVTELTATGALLNLKSSKSGESFFCARLDGESGPIIDVSTILGFKMKSLNGRIIGFVVGEDGYQDGVIRFKVTPRTVIENDDPATPEQEGLFFEIRTHGSGMVCAENGQTTLRIHSNRQNEEGIFTVAVIRDPAGGNCCHAAKAIQVNSPEVDVGDSPGINPGIWLAKKLLKADREMSDEVQREYAPNLHPEDYEFENERGKQIYQVWDHDNQFDGRWTEEVAIDDSVPPEEIPLELERRFFSASGKITIAAPDGGLKPRPNRHFTVRFQGQGTIKDVGVRMKKSAEFGLRGGSSEADNYYQNIDEVIAGRENGYLAWDGEFPLAHPTVNVPPNFHYSPFDGYRKDNDYPTHDESWDHVVKTQDLPRYKDYGTIGGNMFGAMDVYIARDVSEGSMQYKAVKPNIRPKEHDDISDVYWSAGESDEVPFHNLITKYRLEADGWTGENDTSSRDAYPDIVPAPVHKVEQEGITIVRTRHNGSTGVANPVPVHITLRTTPGTSVRVGVTMATMDRGNPANDSLKTHKAWVHASDSAILEYRGQQGQSDLAKADEVYEVISFGQDGSAATKKAERVVYLTLTADENWFAGQTVYVYGIEPTIDRRDELKLVVWGEEVSGWKANTLSQQDHHHEDLELVSSEDEFGNPLPVRRWYVTDEEPVNVVNMHWVDHANNIVDTAVEMTDEEVSPYMRNDGEPGGRGGFAGPPVSTGFSYYQHPFRIESLVFNPAGQDGLKSVTCELISNVSNTPTNAISETNSFELIQLSPNSNAYSASNGTLGIWPNSDPIGEAGQRRTFKALVVNPIFGFIGDMCFYETDVLSNIYKTRQVLLTATFDSYTSPETIQSMSATLVSDVSSSTGHLSEGPVQLIETAVDSNRFESADGSFVVELNRITDRGSEGIDDFTAQVDNSLLEFSGLIDAIESSPSSLEFRTDLLENQGVPIREGNTIVIFGRLYRVGVIGLGIDAERDKGRLAIFSPPRRFDSGSAQQDADYIDPQIYDLVRETGFVDGRRVTWHVFELFSRQRFLFVHHESTKTIKHSNYSVPRMETILAGEVVCAAGDTTAAWVRDKREINTQLLTILFELLIHNGGSDLDNGEVRGAEGELVPSADKFKFGAYILSNWDDDDADGVMTSTGAWTQPPVPDCEESNTFNEDNLARLRLHLTPTPEEGILTLEVRQNGEGTIKLWLYPEKFDSPLTLQNSKYSWDLSDPESRNEYLEILERGGIWIEGLNRSSAERDVRIDLVYSSTDIDLRTARSMVRLTVVEMNLGNAVYRDNDIVSHPLPEVPVGFPWRGHAALVTRFLGPCTRDALFDNDKYMLIEMQWGGPTGHRRLSATVDGRQKGCYTNPDITNVQRLKILKAASFLRGRSIAYTYLSDNALLPKSWDGRLDTITSLRCDGLVEVCYEKNGVMVWGFHHPDGGSGRIFDITDQTDAYGYSEELGVWTVGANGLPDSLERHNDADFWDYHDTLQPATQAGYEAPIDDTLTKFQRMDLCKPIGSKGGNE